MNAKGDIQKENRTTCSEVGTPQTTHIWTADEQPESTSAWPGGRILRTVFPGTRGSGITSKL